MPAKNLSRIDEDGIYLHIYNKGVENRALFNNEEDYGVFLDYLKDYLTAPKDPKSIQKVFEVHGHKFRGIPHQPKNYLNKVELIAYSLMPNHFHLLLHQKTRGSIEGFIRSLCTRYSIYFNKKYKRTGSLFEGPYKSVSIDIEPHLTHLTRYLHHTGGYSSYPEYLGLRSTSWVKPEIVLSKFDNYKAFVEKYELDQKEKANLTGIIFESETEHFEMRDPAKNAEIHPDPVLESRSNVPDFLAISIAVFLLLFTLGIGNIKLSTIKSSQSIPSPAVLGSTAVGSFRVHFDKFGSLWSQIDRWVNEFIPTKYVEMEETNN